MTEEPTVFGTMSSNIPRLANNAIVCARYTHNFNFSEMSGVQLPPVAVAANSASLTSASMSC